MKTRTLDLGRIYLGAMLLIAASLAALLASGVAHGQTGRNPSAEVAPLDPLAMRLAPGQWREYQFTGGATEGSTVRWTWLETEQQAGQTYQWFETRMEQNGQVLISRVLGSIDDPIAPPVRVIMQTGDMPPREMPEEMRQMAAPALKRNLLNPPVQLPEAATIEVPAGKFAATVYESRIGGEVARTYYSTELPGMISYEAAAGGMQLTAYGSGGKTAISGEIVPYKPLPEGVKPSVSRKQAK